MNLFSTLTAWNETELDAMFALADDFGVRLRFQGPVGPRGGGDTAPMHIQPSAAGWARLREIADQRRAEQPETVSPSPGDECAPPAADATDQYHCGAGSEEIHVDPFGNVLPCVQWRMPIGNLHERGLRELWQGGSDTLDLLRAAAKDPESVEALLGEIGLAGGADPRLDAARRRQ